MWEEYCGSAQFDAALNLFRKSLLPPGPAVSVNDDDEAYRRETLDLFLDSDEYMKAFQAYLPIHQRQTGCYLYDQEVYQFFTTVISNFAFDLFDSDPDLVRKLCCNNLCKVNLTA
jgi:hypothetical protein